MKKSILILLIILFTKIWAFADDTPPLIWWYIDDNTSSENNLNLSGDNSSNSSEDNLWDIDSLLNNLTDTSDLSLTDVSDNNLLKNTGNNNYSSTKLVDNIVYNTFAYIKGDYVYIYYTPWKWVENVKILYSYDKKNFIPIITLSARKKFYYFPVDFTKKEIYIKTIPIVGNQEGIMKEWTNTISYINIPLVSKKVADRKVGHAKTGPELWLLFVFSLLIYIIYRFRKIS